MIDEKHLWTVLEEAKAYALEGYEFYGVKEALKEQNPRKLARRLRELAQQTLTGVLLQPTEAYASACAGCAWTLQKMADALENEGKPGV